jgi:hypothetical protein
MHDIFLNYIHLGEKVGVPRIRNGMKLGPDPTRWQYTEVVEVSPLWKDLGLQKPV